MASIASSALVLDAMLYLLLPVPRIALAGLGRQSVHLAVPLLLLAGMAVPAALAALLRRRGLPWALPLACGIGAVLAGGWHARAGYRAVAGGSSVRLVQATAFADSSAVLRTMARDAEREFAELRRLFGPAAARPVRIVVFPSRRELAAAIGSDDPEQVAATNPYTGTVYIPVSDWRAVIRHELVHHFQAGWARRSVRSWLRYVLRHDPIEQESLAYYLAPGSALSGARPVDYVRTFRFTPAQWRRIARSEGLPPRPDLPAQDRYVLDVLVGTWRWHRYGSAARAVAAYQGGAREPGPGAADPVPPRDSAAEQALASRYGRFFPTHRAPAPEFRSWEAFRAQAARLPAARRRAVMEWHLRHLSSVTERVPWEVALDTLGAGGRPARAARIHWQAWESASSVRDDAELRAAVARLRRLVAESHARGERNLAGYAYLRLVHLEWLSGVAPLTPFPGPLAPTFNLYHREYLDDLHRRARPPR